MLYFVFLVVRLPPPVAEVRMRMFIFEVFTLCWFWAEVLTLPTLPLWLAARRPRYVELPALW